MTLTTQKNKNSASESESISISSTVVAVVGLGYVGLPLVVESCKSGLKVLGYDNNSEKVNNLQKGSSPIEDISDESLKEALDKGLIISDSPEGLKDCEHVVISVPTPLTVHQG